MSFLRDYFSVDCSTILANCVKNLKKEIQEFCYKTVEKINNQQYLVELSRLFPLTPIRAKFD